MCHQSLPRLALATVLATAISVAPSFTLSSALSAEVPFTVEEVLAAPLPSELVASPVGARIAWVSNVEGIRNVWVAEAPAWSGRRITSYAADDGQEIGALAFTPGGERILFVRGGGPNRSDEIPNPTSDPQRAEQALWIVGVPDGEPCKLAETGRFEISPRGGRVAFIQDRQVWTVPLDGQRVRDGGEPSDGGGEEEEDDDLPEATKLFTVRRGVSDLEWSPDGRRLAFVSDRETHSFVGVFNLETEKLRWLGPSVDQDRSPTWSPDGERVAFVRLPREKQVLPFTPQREGVPWSIVVADAANGETREVFRADEGPGSAWGPGYWFAGEALLWGAEDRLVFPWEKNGWLHLWSVDAAGGEPLELTSGEGEVEYTALAADRRTVVYASNHGDSERRHLWSVEVTGGPSRQLTTGDGIEWEPELAADGTVAFLASGARTPAHPEVLADGERREIAGPPSPADFPTDRLVAPQAVTFSAADGMRIHGQLFEPPERCDDGPHPGLLFFHGGSRRQMLLGFHPRGYYHRAYAFNQLMASRCFVVLSVNYRSGIGYGLEFREALDYGARGASEYQDVVGAGLFLGARPEVDGRRIGLWGGSYGGYLTALGLARSSDLFAAGVDLHGVHDWNVVIRNFAPEYDPEEREEAAKLAHESSPMAHVATWRSPVLLIHGDDDRNVPFSETVDLVEALRRQGVRFEQLVFPDEVHGFLLHRNWLAAYRRAAAFLQRELAER